MNFLSIFVILVLQVLSQNINASPVSSSIDIDDFEDFAKTGLNPKRHSARSVLEVRRRDTKKSSRKGIKQLRKKFEKKLDEMEFRYQERITKLEKDMQKHHYDYDIKLSTLESRLTLLASSNGFVLYDDAKYDGQDLENIHVSHEEAEKLAGGTRRLSRRDQP